MMNSKKVTAVTLSPSKVDVIDITTCFDKLSMTIPVNFDFFSRMTRMVRKNRELHPCFADNWA